MLRLQDLNYGIANNLKGLGLMNLSMKWLADYVDVNMPIKDYCHALTMSIKRYLKQF